MFFINELPRALTQLANILCVVFHRLFQGAVLLQHVVRAYTLRKYSDKCYSLVDRYQSYETVTIQMSNDNFVPYFNKEVNYV